jgi:hypothetical protein
LPRINNNDSWAWDVKDDHIPIDGFGSREALWPAGLPNTYDYWTGTESGDRPGYSWKVEGNRGNVFFIMAPQENLYRVVCVK